MCTSICAVILPLWIHVGWERTIYLLLTLHGNCYINKVWLTDGLNPFRKAPGPDEVFGLVQQFWLGLSRPCRSLVRWPWWMAPKSTVTTTSRHSLRPFSCYSGESLNHGHRFKGHWLVKWQPRCFLLYPDVRPERPGRRWWWPPCMGRSVIPSLTSCQERSTPVGPTSLSSTSWASTASVPSWWAAADSVFISVAA